MEEPVVCRSCSGAGQAPPAAAPSQAESFAIRDRCEGRPPRSGLAQPAGCPAPGRRSRRDARAGGRSSALSDLPDPAAELLVGISPAMVALRYAVGRVAETAATVLVTGPTGAGKENVARALHLLSPRATCPFVAINCGAIPAELAEAELFGAEAGAFTGAARARPGVFEQAHGGTLFLDELGELPPVLQVKLLRVLETREVTRLGGGQPRRVDVRLVAATNRDLAEEVARGQFRADLYWRLAVVCLDVPPLAARPEDVPLLLAHFAARSGQRLSVSECGARRLAGHPWPGNVRELRNLVERALAYGEELIDAAAAARLLGPAPPAGDRLPWPWPAAPAADPSGAIGRRPPAPAGDRPPLRLPQGFEGGRPLEPVALKALLREAEAALIAQALEASGGTVAGAGRMLGIKRTTLLEKMKRMGLRPPANEAA